ncbi:hypothetical protein GCM10018772_20530 [Streptomyces fumanus]|uniref:Uncharacterized protein n=1 Tax=Streptomyces fumanus TaxID=67302 RepID=A0A919E072_9ACTN|nr:hypothetical protein GCM10018772_20530 [Streptomyces fumanus]
MTAVIRVPTASSGLDCAPADDPETVAPVSSAFGGSTVADTRAAGLPVEDPPSSSEHPASAVSTAANATPAPHLAVPVRLLYGTVLRGLPVDVLTCEAPLRGPPPSRRPVAPPEHHRAGRDTAAGQG